MRFLERDEWLVGTRTSFVCVGAVLVPRGSSLV